MFESCLICSDLADGLHRLADFVPFLANSGLRQIVFFHSVPLNTEGTIPKENREKMQQAENILTKALTEVPSGIEVKVEVLAGDAVPNILRLREKYQSQVILTGTPLRSLLQEKMMGSTSTGIAKLTSTPLMIFRPQILSTYTKEELALRCQHLWRSLLIPYNDSKAARYLIEKIKAYGSKTNLKHIEACMLMWVVEEGGRQEFLKEYRLQEAREKLKIVKEELEQFGWQVEIQVREGNPLQEIFKAALNFDISAIAIATDRRESLLEWTVPSFANDLLHKSWFPLLFFPAEK